MTKTFQQYWERLPPPGKRALEQATGIRSTHLSQIAHGHRIPNAKTLAKLFQADERFHLEFFCPQFYTEERERE
jgi:transcriptional regulator with XRE-family HTH domain